MENVKVIILAGGVGKRFWPIQTSKVLVPFMGKSLFSYILEDLVTMELKDFIVVTNTFDKASIDTLRIPGTHITTVVQEEAKGMADAVLAARPLVGDGPCLVKNALDVFDRDFYKRAGQKLQEKKTFVVAKKNDTYFDGGYYKLDGDRVTGIVEKPGAGNEPSNLTDVVFHYFQKPKDFFDILTKTTSDRDDVYEKALNAFLSTNETDCLIHEGVWLPVKYPWHLLGVMDYFLKEYIKDHRGKNVEIKSNVTIVEPVYIEDNVKIFENTKIVGPCYIGKDTVIGNNNIIRNSHIGNDCVTGFNTDITRSYVGNQCWFHSNYVGDSVLGENVSMGAGTVLANLRLDEGEIVSSGRNKLGAIVGKNVRIGVNTSIMPGVKVGSNSFIGAGTVVPQDIPDNSFCMGKQTLTISKNTKSITSKRDEFRKKI